VFDTGLWTEEVLGQRAKQHAMTVEEYKTNNVLKTQVGSRDGRGAGAEMCGALSPRPPARKCPWTAQ